jgi:ATP-dependent DNA helicase RecQ
MRVTSLATHLGSSSQLHDAVARYWGYTSFRPLQRDAMDAVLAGRDSIVVLPTGGGKSLCFQAPAVVHQGLAVVVSPLISLMKDQVDTLVGNGVPAGLYNSSLSSEEKALVVAGLRQGRYRLLYVSPERLVGDGGESFLSLLSSCPSPVSFVAVDEAHCISQWGHDFRPEYRQLGRLRQLLPGVAVHAYTATATARVRKDIAAQLALKDPIEFVGSFDRPNLVYRVLPRATLKKQLLDVLDRHRREAGIIYCTSRREVDALAEWLSSVPGLGIRALPYHAGLSDTERSRNQDAFLSERADIIVATVAFGMGIDRSDVRYVVHAGAPRSLEHYQQESGRAGRDGLEAECLLVYSAADFMRWRVMLERNGEFTDATRTLMRGMERYATGVGCRHRHLSEYFGDRYQPAGADGCAACDFCLDELEAAPSPIVLARQILSCVARVGQRFGATHVASVLRGHASDAVLARGHEKLSTFGLLPNASVTEVRGYIEQLAGLGLLQQVGDEYPVLALTTAGTTLLKDETSFPDLVLARQRPPRKDKGRTQSRVEAESWQDVDRDLFERLRAVRLDIARSRGVPPYVIFHDATLREMARLRPTSINALLGVKGVGARKADDLGETFLSAIRESMA